MKPNSFRPDPSARDRQTTPLATPCSITICRVGKVVPQRPHYAANRVDMPLGPRGMNYRRDITTGTILGDMRAT
jgi:hypothetical protein